MSINFCPNRKQMLREVEACAAAGKLEVLRSLCTCCVYAVFETSMLVPHCFQCSVRLAIRTLSGPQEPEDLAVDHEFLGYC